MSGESSKLKRYTQLFLVVAAAGSIFPLIYLKTSYQQTILTVYGLELSQLNTIYVALGFAFIIGYMPSGFIADRVNLKLLIAFSLFATALGGVWFATVPSYSSLILIFVIWGFSSVLTFWGSHMKAVKLLATENEQGKFFGILDGGRGLVEALLASAAVVVFSMLSNNDADKAAGLKGVIYLYVGMLVLLGILVVIFLDVDKKVDKTKPVKKDIMPVTQGVPIVIKNKMLWILGGVIFSAYIVTWTIYYIGGFLETDIELTAKNVAIVTTIILWMRPIGGFLAGALGDKFGKPLVLVIGLIISSAGLIIASILPYDFGSMIFVLLLVFAGLGIYAVRGTYWSLLDDCKVDGRVLGLSIGFVSLIGYIPDVLIPIANTKLFEVFGDFKGYNAYFIVSALFGVVSIILVGAYKKNVKRS